MQESSHNSTYAEITQALEALLEPGSVCEIRIPKSKRGTRSGYFNNFETLANQVASLSGSAPGIYITINPVRGELLSRAINRVEDYAKHSTSDRDIVRRRWLPIDFDPVRPAGISSIDSEHAAALTRAMECRDWLSGQGWPAPLFADSGNGAHLLYRLDLPNEVASCELIKNCLQALSLQFSDQSVSVDLTTFNAARIWKIYGTLAAKGDSTPDRPHRLARILEIPEELIILQTELLERLAVQQPKPAARPEEAQRIRMQIF